MSKFMAKLIYPAMSLCPATVTKEEDITPYVKEHNLAKCNLSYIKKHFNQVNHIICVDIWVEEDAEFGEINETE